VKTTERDASGLDAEITDGEAEAAEDAGDEVQEFIEWTEKLGLARVAALVANACEVEADSAADDGLGREWSRLVPEFEKLARRVKGLADRGAARARWNAAKTTLRMSGDFIGRESRYLGGEWPASEGARFRILGVVRRCEGGQVISIRDNDLLARLGGVSARDLVEVRPIKENGRESFVAAETYAMDFEIFAPLRGTADKP
jgi:hypothetical protein